MNANGCAPLTTQQPTNATTNEILEPGVPIPIAWNKFSFENGDYEGEILNSLPHGFGRIVWTSGVAYHGEFQNQKFHGKGCFFFDNGDRFEGEFRDHKPTGAGIMTIGERRFHVSYDGTQRLSDGATPTFLDEHPVPEVIADESKLPVTAISKGIKTQPFGLGDYRHCKPIDAKLAFASPFRAHRALVDPAALAGRIAVVQRGGCSLARKLRHVQGAGAVAMLVLGLDPDDKYRAIFQVLSRGTTISSTGPPPLPHFTAWPRSCAPASIPL
jgi:hypothetical protein